MRRNVGHRSDRFLIVPSAVIAVVAATLVFAGQTPQRENRDAGSATAKKGKADAASDAKASAAAEAKRADIRRLMDITGAGKLGLQVMGQMIAQFRNAMPEVPPEFWDEFATSIDADELVELTLPAYEKHLTHDDIKALIKFYESPVGRKLVSVQPLILQDSMAAGKKWGEGMARKIMEKLREEGYPTS